MTVEALCSPVRRCSFFRKRFPRGTIFINGVLAKGFDESDDLQAYLIRLALDLQLTVQPDPAFVIHGRSVYVFASWEVLKSIERDGATIGIQFAIPISLLCFSDHSAVF
jgi:hypothetical protein